MTSPTHDATALAAAFVLFPPSGDASPLLVTAGLICVMGLLEAVAHARQKRAEERVRERLNELRALGIEDPQPTQEEYEAMRWKGPRRSFTRPLRLLAVIGAAVVSMPIAVALGCARLPDQLEIGPWKVQIRLSRRWKIHLFTIPGIPHRWLTHFLLTAASVVFGVRYGLLSLQAWSEWRPALGISRAAFTVGQAETASRALATGYGAHLAMDGCTKHGVPLFWPFWREDVHLLPQKLRPRTGYPVDTLVMLGALAGVALAVQG